MNIVKLLPSASVLTIVSKRMMFMQEETLGGWKLRRNIDGEDKVNFTFSQEVAIKPMTKVKVRKWIITHPARISETSLSLSLSTVGLN